MVVEISVGLGCACMLVGDTVYKRTRMRGEGLNGDHDNASSTILGWVGVIGERVSSKVMTKKSRRLTVIVMHIHHIRL